MRQAKKAQTLELGMRRIAAYVEQQVGALGLGPVHITWTHPHDDNVHPYRITLRVATCTTSQEVTLYREPVEDYGRETDVAMTQAVVRELVRRVAERCPV